MASVRIERVAKAFNETAVLHDVSVDIADGEFVVLVGPSGCGKSTLLNMVAGLDLPTEGVVTLEGHPITKPGPDRMVVFQNYSLLPWRTVRENIALAVNSVLKDLVSRPYDQG